MAHEALKFDFNGSTHKIFFRYPDRVIAPKLTDEEKKAIEEEEAAVRFKKETITALLATAAHISPEDYKIIFKNESRPVRKGSGPITTECHIVKQKGVNPENGKSLFEEAFKPVDVKFHTSSNANSYEKARQHALYKYFKENKIIRGTTYYDAVVKAYESRAEQVPNFQHTVYLIEKL